MEIQKKNKARDTRPFGQEQGGQSDKIIKKVNCDQPTDRPTDQRTKRVVESRARD